MDKGNVCLEGKCSGGEPARRGDNVHWGRKIQGDMSNTRRGVSYAGLRRIMRNKLGVTSGESVVTLIKRREKVVLARRLIKFTSFFVEEKNLKRSLLPKTVRRPITTIKSLESNDNVQHRLSGHASQLALHDPPRLTQHWRSYLSLWCYSISIHTFSSVHNTSPSVCNRVIPSLRNIQPFLFCIRLLSIKQMSSLATLTPTPECSSPTRATMGLAGTGVGTPPHPHQINNDGYFLPLQRTFHTNLATTPPA